MKKKKTIWVNGGTWGIGLETAIRFARKGYNVISTYSTELPDALEHLSNKIIFFRADCSVSEDVQECADMIRQQYGVIDILVNCAAAGSTESQPDPLLFTETVQTNLIGKYNCICAALPLLKLTSNGCIINIASASGENPSAEMTSYCSAASGIIMMTRCLARQLGEYNIRVNCISPSMLDTGMSLKSFTPDDMQYIASVTPLKRLCRTSDVCNCIEWLCSEEASYINGTNIMMTGGK